MLPLCPRCAACSACADIFWPSDCLSADFNRKKERTLRICRPCNVSYITFRAHLEKGHLSGALEVFRCGRVRTVSHPFGCSPADGAYAIHCAAAGGNVELVRWLVESMSVPVNVTDKSKNLPIRVAAKFNRGEAMRYLIQHCAQTVVSITDVKMLQSLLLNTMLCVQSPLPETFGVFPGHSTTAAATATATMTSPPSIAPAAPPSATATAPSSQPQPPQQSRLCASCYNEPALCKVQPCGHSSMCYRCASNQAACVACGGHIQRVDPLFT